MFIASTSRGARERFPTSLARRRASQRAVVVVGRRRVDKMRRAASIFAIHRRQATPFSSSLSSFAGHGIKATTVLCVRKDGQVVLMADGQVTMGSEIVKPNVKKVRVIQPGVIGGFAGATADAFTLFERLENKLEEHPGELTRAAVELAKAWRNDKFLRKLEATMIVADKTCSFQITGSGDVLEPHDGVIGIGSGGSYALAAARALVDVPGLTAYDVAKKAMTIAADTCVYTNHNFTYQIINADGTTSSGEGGESKIK